MKIAMILVISGMLACPQTSRADECVSGKSRMLVESTKIDDALGPTEFIVRLESKAPMTLETLKKDYILLETELQVGYRETYFGTPPSLRFEPKEARNEADGSLCLEFVDFRQGLYSTPGLLNVSAVNGGRPVVCVSKVGVVTSTLKVDVDQKIRAPQDETTPKIFMRAKVKANAPGQIVLIDASTEACK